MKDKDFVCQQLAKIVVDLTIQDKEKAAAPYKVALASIEKLNDLEFERYLRSDMLTKIDGIGIFIAKKIQEIASYNKDKSAPIVLKDKIVTRKTLNSLAEFIKEPKDTGIKVFQIPYQDPFKVSEILGSLNIPCTIEIESNSLLLCLLD